MRYIQISTTILFLIFLSSCDRIRNRLASEETVTKVDPIVEYFETEEALELNEEGVNLSKKGDYLKGRKKFMAAWELEENNPVVLSNLGLSHFYTSDFGASIGYYQNALLVSDSAYFNAAIGLSKTYQKMNHNKQGLESADFVIKNAKRPSILALAHINKATNLVSLSKCKEAQYEFNYVVKKYSRKMDLSYELQDLQERLEYCF